MTKEVSQNLWSVQDILLEFQQVFFHIFDIFVTELGILVKELYDNIDHIIWEDVILEEFWAIVNIMRWGVLM